MIETAMEEFVELKWLQWLGFFVIVTDLAIIYLKIEFT